MPLGSLCAGDADLLQRWQRAALEGGDERRAALVGDVVAVESSWSLVSTPSPGATKAATSSSPTSLSRCRAPGGWGLAQRRRQRDKPLLADVAGVEEQRLRRGHPSSVGKGSHRTCGASCSPRGRAARARQAPPPSPPTSGCMPSGLMGCRNEVPSFGSPLVASGIASVSTWAALRPCCPSSAPSHRAAGRSYRDVDRAHKRAQLLRLLPPLLQLLQQLCKGAPSSGRRPFRPGPMWTRANSRTGGRPHPGVNTVSLGGGAFSLRGRVLAGSPLPRDRLFRAWERSLKSSFSYLQLTAQPGGGREAVVCDQAVRGGRHDESPGG